MKKVPFPSCAREAHVRCMKNSEENTSILVSASFWESLPIPDQQTFFFVFSSQAFHKPLVRMMEKVLFHDFHCFQPCKRMRKHAQACIHWSKYTTPSCFCQLLKIAFFKLSPASEASIEVANLTERKNLHTPVYGVCLSVFLSVCDKL